MRNSYILFKSFLFRGVEWALGITQVKYPVLNLKGLVKFICNTLPYCQLRLQCLSYLLPLWSQLQSTSGVAEALALSAPPVSVPGRSKAKAGG